MEDETRNLKASAADSARPCIASLSGNSSLWSAPAKPLTRMPRSRVASFSCFLSHGNLKSCWKSHTAGTRRRRMGSGAKENIRVRGLVLMVLISWPFADRHFRVSFGIPTHHAGGGRGEGGQFLDRRLAGQDLASLNSSKRRAPRGTLMENPFGRIGQRKRRHGC